MGRMIDISGEVYGQWTVMHELDSIDGNAMCMCRCACGKEKPVRKARLVKGVSTNCGCDRNIKHGLSRDPLYFIWMGMKQRCYNENNKFYKNYGGSGIKVCDEWESDFTPFYEWSISNGWKPGLQIDRIITTLNYSPNNCRYVTQQQNLYNRGPNKSGSSKYKGVSFYKSKNIFVGAIDIDGKKKSKSFELEICAALWYDSHAEELRGEYAWLNRNYFEEIMNAWLEKRERENKND